MQSGLTPRSWTRRDFVAGAGISATALTIGISPLFGAEPSVNNQQPLTVGFLGVTHTHAMEKLAVICADPAYKLVGVCEQSESARQALTKQGVSLLSRDELLEHSAVIVVESMVRDHAQHALLALKAGKHLHVEKPTAATLGEMREMVSLAQSGHLVLQTGYMWRYNQ